MTTKPWWRDAVIYQIYPRSFQDSDGDGIGDVRGITGRLGHLSDLGVDAVWLSPIYPSPLADGGYDIADFTGVDPRLGTIADVAELAAAAHRRGMALLLDIVPNHTSIEHPWFRAHPDWYVWADAPANNWRAAFGGPAWTRDERTGRFYLHSFYPEQPDLDWRNPAVVAAMQDVLRFWRGHGADGFRLDALDRIGKDPGLRDDPPRGSRSPSRRNPRWPPSTASTRATSARRWTWRSGRCGRRRGTASSSVRSTGGRPSLGPYLEHLDSAFAFELLFADWRADVLGGVIERGARVGRVSWMLSNHDFSRVGSRIGERNLPRRRHAPAHAARHGVPLSGRRDRHARRAGGRPAGRSLRPRRPAPPDAVGRRARAAGSRPVPGGFRPSTRPCATWPTSAATPTRCSRSTGR